MTNGLKVREIGFLPLVDVKATYVEVDVDGDGDVPT
jgi:hypothetical protein